MTTPTRKMIRDLARERARTVLVVLAIALGLASFIAVLASYAILTRELNTGYLETNPASATLSLGAIDDELLQAVAARPGVSAVEARRTISGRIKTGPVEWRNLVLFVVKDYGSVRISKLKPQQGAWPPGPGEILIERDALQVARAGIGDVVLVRTARGTERPLLVMGTVKDVGQAQARMENLVYGYITQETLARLGEEPYLDRLLLLVDGNRSDEAHVREVAEDVKRFVEGRGQTVRRLDVPTPGKHPHAELMGLLLLAMAGFGLFALILSSILVVNLLTGLMASQTRQIGVMKALGGTRGQIARIYFGQAALLGGAAVLLALPAGIVGCRVLCRYLAVFLNFDITSFAIPLWVFLLVALAGLAVPLLAAASPVWSGASVSVREALADAGTSQTNFGANRFDRALAGLGGQARPLLFAIRNNFRRRGRLALTVLTLAIGGLFFMAALNIRASMIHTLDRLFASKNFDLSVNLGAMSPVDKIDRALRETPGISRAEAWVATQGTAPKSAPASSPSGVDLHGESDSDRFGVIGLPGGSTLLQADLAEGRGLLPSDTGAVMLVNTALAARDPRMKVGSDVLVRIGDVTQSWRVIGLAREPFTPPVAYVPMEQAGGPAGQANTLRLKLEATDRASINRLKAALDRSLEREGLRAQSSLSKDDSRFGFDQHMVMIYVFLIIMSCILGGVGGLGLMTTLSLNVLERRREMGVLRAIGATPGMVWRMVAAEGIVIGLLGWAFAGLAAWPVSQGIGNLLMTLMFKSRLEFSFEWIGLALWLGISLLLGGIASALPARHASRASVREAIEYE